MDFALVQHSSESNTSRRGGLQFPGDPIRAGKFRAALSRHISGLSEADLGGALRRLQAKGAKT